MQRRTLVVGAVVALVIVVGAVAAFGGGLLGTSASPSGESGEVTSFPTATATPSDGAGSGGGSDAGGATTATPEPAPAFAFTVEQIEKCGQTCRDVTSSVENDGEETATSVTVYSRIFVGNSTAEDDLAWQGKEQVGTLDAGETHAATKRVKLSYSEALAVKRADGWITVQTTVQSDEKTVTFTRRRDVA